MYKLEPIDEENANLEEKVEQNKEKMASPEASKIDISVEKKPGQEISSAEKDNAYSRILSQVKAAPAEDVDDQEVARDAAAVTQKTDAESQIQHLVGLAMQKGLFHAVKVTQHMQDNYILDMFHDKLLSEELHNALIKKGLIKEE